MTKPKRVNPCNQPGAANGFTYLCSRMKDHTGSHCDRLKLTDDTITETWFDVDPDGNAVHPTQVEK